jgi:hypothetical protein
VGITIRRSYFDPASAVLKFVIDRDAEPQILNVETEASFLIADENDYEMKTKIRVIVVQPQERSFDAKGELVRAHHEDYTVVSGCRASAAHVRLSAL